MFLKHCVEVFTIQSRIILVFEEEAGIIQNYPSSTQEEKSIPNARLYLLDLRETDPSLLYTFLIEII